MKLFLMIGVPLAIPFIAWVPAEFWTMCGNPWCLKVYPDWLDRMISSLALPYLDTDIGTAAEQLEFIEVYIASVVIMEVVAAALLFKFKDKFNDDEA
jgi:hypothetical protein